MFIKIAAVCLAGALMPSLSSAEEPVRNRYALKEQYIDSHIPFRYASFKLYPLDRAYNRFTEQEKQAFKDLYQPMQPGDEPPFPEQGLQPVIKKLSYAISRMKVEGEVTLHITVNAEGEATQFQIYQASSQQAAELVAHVFSQTKFKPAICDGKPCQMDFPFYTNLKLSG